MSAKLYAYINGKIVPEEKATVSIKTHAFNYGTCAFEGMKAFYLGRKRWNLFRLDDHIDRLLRTCDALHIASPATHDEISTLITKLVLKNSLPKDTYVRPMIYCNPHGLGLGRPVTTDLAIFCQPVNKIHLREFDTLFSKNVRIPPSVVPSIGKITGTYVGSFIAQREVSERGGTIALMKSIDGHVAEAFGMNLFVVRKNKCYTPSLSAGPLDGITRRSIFEFCRRGLGLKAEERLFTPRFMYNADEVFLCGTGAGINAVTMIEGRKIGSGKCGPITRELSDLYWSVIHAKNADYEDWCNIVAA